METAFDIAKFDSYKEDNCREVKSAKGGLPNSLWETYSAFANCRGGVIVLGVTEQSDGRWQTTGLTNERKLLKDFWDIINNKKKVSRNILSDRHVETFSESKTGDCITGKTQMLKGGISDPRNKALMKMFNLINIGERAGSGVPDICSAWSAVGWIDPQVEEQYNPDRTILTLSFSAKQLEKTSGNLTVTRAVTGNVGVNVGVTEKIIEEMKINSSINLAQIAEKLGLHKRHIERLVSGMKKKGRLRRIGPDKGGHWEVVE